MNGKVCFVFMGNMYLCPYITKYIEYMNCMNVDFDILYWNRDDIKENIKAKNLYSFNFQLKAEDSNIKKLKGYWKFKKYASKILSDNNYGGVILLQTAAGILLQQILKKKYYKRYILDIRDYTMEKNKFFYYIERYVINNSNITVISSEGYKSFLPNYNYVIVHNIRTIDKKICTSIRNRNKKKNKLVIGFIGYIHYQEQNKRLLKIFKNDQRFELHFIGKESEKLLPFCEQNNIGNVKLIGQFPPEKILKYYQDVDIIHNLYGNKTPVLDYALSNKLYFAAQLGMPILVCPETFMEKISLEYGFGYTFEMSNLQAVDELYNYYKNIDWQKFLSGCDKFLQKIELDSAHFKKEVTNFLK